MSAAGFTLATSAGQQVTVKETSSITREQGSSPVSITAVTTGAPVLVLGTTDSTTVTAAQVIEATLGRLPWRRQLVPPSHRANS